jgi:hypothetical protein
MNKFVQSLKGLSETLSIHAMESERVSNNVVTEFHGIFTGESLAKTDLSRMNLQHGDVRNQSTKRKGVLPTYFGESQWGAVHW